MLLIATILCIILKQPQLLAFNFDILMFLILILMQYLNFKKNLLSKLISSIALIYCNLIIKIIFFYVSDLDFLVHSQFLWIFKI